MTKSKFKALFVSFLLAAVAVCLSVGLAACKDDNDKDGGKYGVGEEGFYYYDGADSARYMLSLQSGTYMITVNGASAYSGTYSYDEESGKVSFKGDTEFAATLGESALSLDMEGSGYSFKAFKYFDVSYVDGNGNVVYTDSVLNGQSPANISGENLKDGYWFIDWYVDSSNSAVYSFDTSIAGDTVIYGWFVEKSASAVEHTITLDYGDGYTESMSTMNGTIYRELPTAYGGLTVMGWWVSATNKSGELTYKYATGEVFDADTTLFAVYEGLGSSVTSEGVTWDTSKTGSNVTITVTDLGGKESFSDTVQSSSGSYISDRFTNLEAGVYTVTISSGSGEPETRIYVVNGLSRVSLSESDIIVNGSGRVLSFAPVEGADGYKITVTNGEKTVTEDLGSHTYYNFSDWEMTKEGITFVVTAYADGYADSVSDEFTYLLVLGNITLDISDDVVSWTRVDGALEYVVTVTDVDGNVIDSFRTSDTSFSLKYYENGTYDITVQPHTDGYYSEAKTYFGYAKDSLMAPKITNVSGYEVSWEAVEGATSYVVLINGVEYETTGTTLVFSDSNVPTTASSYEISVKAVKEGGSDSPYSDIVVATEEFSSAVSYDKNTIYWNYDIAAAYYGVSVNGDSEMTTDGGNSFKVTLTKAGNNIITVTAYDAEGVSLGSAEITVYAYSVVLDPNGATLVNDSADSAGTIYVAQGDELNLGTVEKDYADFVGWYTQADYTNGQSDTYEGVGSLVGEGSTFTGNGAMYLYAYWTYQYIDVTLDAGSGTLADEDGKEITSVKIKYNSTSFVLPVPAAVSVTDDFVGWCTDPSYGVQYTTETGESNGVAYGTNDVLCARYLTTRAYSKTRYDGDVVYSVSATTDAKSLSVMTVPESYEGYDIILGAGAFKYCTSLKVLNIPDTVRFISLTAGGYITGGGAFAGISTLTDVNVYATGDGPDSSKEPTYFSADGVLFRKIDGTNDAEILYYPYGRGLATYEIPAYVGNENECAWDGTPVSHAVTAIPAQTFRDRKIREIIIPSTVTDVYSNAFYKNTYLKKVTFEGGGNDRLTIEEYAFISCTSLTEVTLPARFSGMDAAIFDGCSALTNVYIESGGTYSSDGGVLLDSTGTTLVFFPTGRKGEVDISSLTSSTITRIGENAFASNTKITSVVIPANVSEICESAFEGCTGISSVTFLGGDNSPSLAIRTRAFYGCKVLYELWLPSNLVTLETDAFGGCTNLIYVYYEARPGAKSSDLNFSSGAFGSTNNITTLEFGAYVPVFDFADVFEGGKISKIIIDEKNDNYSSDEDGVVYNKDFSTILYYPLGRVGEYTVNENTTSIGSGVFANRAGLTSLTIGASVNTIAADAFEGCVNLENIFVDDNNSNFGNVVATSEAGTARDGILYRKEEGELVEILYCPIASAVTSLSAGETIIKVAEGAFRNNTTLTAVQFSATESFELGEYAFYGCESLTTVELPDCMTIIPKYAFSGCSSLSTINIPTNVKTIDDFAFYQCIALTGDLNDATGGVELPEGLETIGKSAFYMYTNVIHSLAIGGGTITPTPTPGFDTGTDDDDTETRTGFAVTIPSTVTLIDDYAFYACWAESTSEVGIVFASAEEGVEDVELVIGDYAFYNATHALSVTIPARTVSIGEYAFYSFGSDAGTDSSGSSGGLTKNFKEVVGGGSTGTTTTIAFEDGCKITEIASHAFYNASNVKEITIPETVETIGEYAFYSCSALTTFNFAPQGKTSELQTISASAFLSCSALTGLEIPASVTTIGNQAFYKLSGADISLAAGSELTYIESEAFSGSGIQSINIPATVAFIGESAFSGCTSLTSVTFEEGSALTTLGSACFSGCTSLASVSLTEGLQSTGVGSTGTFKGCTALSGISVPSSVTTIGERTFSGCTALTTVAFTETSSLEEIEDYAFETCTSLTSFAFPQTTASSIELGTGVFSGCTSLTSITLTSSVTNIGSALSGSSISSIELNGDTEYALSSDGQVLYDMNEKTIVYVCAEITAENLTIPEGIETIGDYAFEGQTAVKSVTLPASLTTIGEYAFSGCTSLSTLTIPEGSHLGSVGDYAFNGCTSLASLDLTGCAWLDYLGGYSFYGCTSLASADVSGCGNLTLLGESAFEGCTSLDTVVMSNNVTEIGDNCFKSCPLSQSDTVISESITYVGSYAFSGTGLTSIKLPEARYIGDDAFSNMKSLVTIELGDFLETLGASAFYQCSALETITWDCMITEILDSTFRDCTSLEYIELPSSVVYINSYAFRDCTALEEIVLPDSLTAIYTYAFDGCTALEVCELPKNLTDIGSNAFNGCTALTGLIFPESLTRLVTSCFSGCSGLQYVVMNDNLEEIGNSAFMNCTSLESVTIGKRVSEMGTSAFAYCTSLTYVYTGDSLTSLGSSTFNGCTSLETVEFGRFMRSIGSSAFSGCVSLKEIVLPSLLDTIASSAFSSCVSLESVVIPSTVEYVASSAFSGCGCDVYIQTTSNYVTTYWTSDWDTGFAGTAYYYTDIEPDFADGGLSYDGNYWCFDDEGNIVVWSYSPDVYTVSESSCFLAYNSALGTIVGIYTYDSQSSEYVSVSFTVDSEADGLVIVFGEGDEAASYEVTLDAETMTAALTAKEDQ